VNRKRTRLPLHPEQLRRAGVCIKRNGDVASRGDGRVVHRIQNGRTFITAEPGGTPDGFRCDVDGNLWCGWGMGNAQQDGVKVFDPAGKPIAFIALPERCANVCFGGIRRNRLFMAASHSLYSLYVNTQGAPL
jgi:gluconolactonase